MMEKMKADYLKDCHQKTTELEKLIRNKDYIGLESFFHKLKGSGASYGLPEFSEFGSMYEEKIKKQELSKEDLNSTLEEFKALLTSHKL